MSKQNAVQVFQTLCGEEDEYEDNEDDPIPVIPPQESTELNKAIAAEAGELRAIVPYVVLGVPAVGAILTKPPAKKGTCHPDIVALKASELPDPFEEDITQHQAKRFIEDGTPQKVAARHQVPLPDIDPPKIEWWVRVLRKALADAVESLKQAHRDHREAVMKAERELAVTAMRKAAEDVRNLSLVLRRLTAYEAADLRINDSRSASSILVRSAVADSMKPLARGKLGAASVQFSPDMLHIALFSLADMVSEYIKGGKTPSAYPALPPPSQAGTEKGGQKDRQAGGSRGVQHDFGASSSSRRPTLWCLWCDNHALKFNLPRALEDKHSTAQCPKDDMPLLCTQPVCQSMDPPLRHKANGHICKAVHATAQSIRRALVAPSLHGQEGGKVSAARGDTDLRAPPNGGGMHG
uniref:Uncharacterized protein n=1 Tax=Chromera velia CCMP2878 TaxID=1169474 RepID=A0A0G4FHY1_9ALVE|eukprot:Cvel_17103.t1-p1 / transcript=Cvel_17103.t1 / gene=Cvel_17103 / organism=Chromera_velia_CCMP2878 / gene_product=hypothetical protein / transcript_product=hypothetical protein / location=Cvel_scaffold1348:39017-40240(-) / protein_length=408 / sequence_SO=supercontig / SO=protein_coding / is_pseudo=false